MSRCQVSTVPREFIMKPSAMIDLGMDARSNAQALVYSDTSA